ncbi:MAG: sugar porter family MFS transporter [Sphingobacteriaceae bacterium]
MSKNAYVYRISIVAAIGGLLFGYDTAVISGTTEAIQLKFNLNDIALGWVVSSALIGCIAGVLIAGWFTDYFGRKKALLLSGLLFAVSAIGSAFPINVDFLIIARLVGGIGVGIASMVTPMYIAEIAPPDKRGALVSLNQVAIVFGMVLAYAANRFIVGLGDEAWMITIGWRWMFGVEVFPAIIFLALTPFIVESPRWFVKKKMFADAKSVIQKITRPELVTSTYNEVIESLQEEEGKIGELFQPKARKTTMMTMVLALFQAITGINIVMYYAPRIFLSAGIGTGDAYGHSIIIGSVMVLFTISSLFLVDRIGRRPLMQTAAAGMGLSLLLMGLVFPQASEQGLLLLICTLSFVSFFSIGMGGIYWVVVSEIFPNRLRGRAMALSVIFLWGGNFIVAQFFPAMLSALQEQVFMVFAVVCFICFIFIRKYVPETKGRSLEAIEHEFFSLPAKK